MRLCENNRCRCQCRFRSTHSHTWLTYCFPTAMLISSDKRICIHDVQSHVHEKQLHKANRDRVDYIETRSDLLSLSEWLISRGWRQIAFVSSSSMPIARCLQLNFRTFNCTQRAAQNRNCASCGCSIRMSHAPFHWVIHCSTANKSRKSNARIPIQFIEQTPCTPRNPIRIPVWK